MKRALVLGAGMVGSVMAMDLAAGGELEVTIADVRHDALATVAGRATRAGRRVITSKADLSDPDEVKRLAAGADVVCGALSSVIGHAALRAVIEAGKPYCDISFMPEDVVGGELDQLAKSRGVTAVVDMGVAPGMSHLLSGHAARLLEPCESLEIYVGGLPRERRWPFEYKAGFSPHDVIEEYTRPSRIVEGGQVVVREALSEPELMDFPGIGTLEAFNTDGLRSLVFTLRGRVPNMKEKTLRYPGHIALMRVFRETGLFSATPVKVKDHRGDVCQVRPLDITAAVMFPKWTYAEGEEDLTVMRVSGVGQRDGRRVRLSWDLLDYYDRNSRATSMSRTTALPCTITARLLAAGKLNRPGVIVPELLADEPGLVEHVLAELAARRVMYKAHEEAL